MFRLIIIIPFLILLLNFIGCVDVNEVSLVDKTSPTINIIKPLSNDSLEIGFNTFRIGAYDDQGLSKIELYIDSVLVQTFFFGSDGSYPLIQWEAAQNQLGKRISYFYKIFDVSGNFSFSPVMHNILIVTVKSPPLVPFNVKLLKISTNVINISWQDTSKVVNGYEIWRKESNSGTFVKVKEVSAGSFNTNDAAIIPELTYYYKICSFNSAGKSQFSNEVFITGTSTSSDLIAPSNITLQALSSKKVLITWKDNSNNENYFKLERKTSNTGFQSISILPANTTFYRDSIGLIAGTEYFYRVKVFTDKDSSISAESSIKLPNYEIDAPSNLKAEMFNASTVRLSWINNSTKATKIIIERKSNPSVNFEEIATISSTNNEWDDGNIQLGMNYVYRIKAADASYSSEYSNQVSILTQPVAINPPSNLFVVYIVGNIMQLSWVDNSSNEIGFIIERKEENSGAEFQQIAFIGMNTTQYNDLGTTAQKTYSYRIAATDGVSKSAYSNTFTILNPGGK